MRLSQSELELIRRRQTGLNTKSRKTVSKNTSIKRALETFAPEALPAYETAQNAASSGNVIADIAGVVTGLTTANPVAAAAVRTTLKEGMTDFVYEGEDEYMRSLGYSGGQWSSSGLWGALSGPNSKFSKELRAYRAKVGQQNEMKRLRLKGSGDYALTSNSLVAGGGVASENLQIITSQRSTRVVYREYLGDVFTHPTIAGAFFITSYDIQPGLVSTFPWLAPIAQQYEQWTPNGVVFEFRSTSSDYVATQALGSVIMATEYDQLDLPFPNKQVMLNSAYANEAKPSCNILHGIECAREDRPVNILFVRSNGVPSGGDIRDYDCGRFSIATQGGATANLNLGSLYVHYDITFRKEQLFNGIAGGGILYDMIGSNTSVTGVASATPLPTLANGNFRAAGATQIMTIGGLGTTIIFPSWITTGRWKVEYSVQSSGATTSLGTVTATTNCNFPTIPLPVVVGNTYPNPNQFNFAGGVGCYTSYIVDITGPNAVLTFSGWTIAATKTQCYVSVLQVGNWPQ